MNNLNRWWKNKTARKKEKRKFWPKIYFLHSDLTSAPLQGLEIFFFVGRKGVLKTQSGLQIAYLSGVDKSDAPEVHVCYNYFAVDTSNILGIYINFFLQGNSKENNTHIVDVMMMWAKRIYWHFSIDDQSKQLACFSVFCFCFFFLSQSFVKRK